MASTLYRLQPDYPNGRRSEESVDAGLASLDRDRRRDWHAPRKRKSRPVVRFLVTFCIGVAATLTWQSFGDAARQVVASSSPVLGWLAPRVASLAQVDSDQAPPAGPAMASTGLQQPRAALLDLAAVRQSVEQVAAQNQQVVGDIAAMQTAQQAILRKLSTPPPPAQRQVTAPARSPAQN
jgi:hypothetical protein